MKELPPELSTQVRIARMLGMGFTFTVVTFGGLGSVVAIVLGARALKIISREREALAGRGLAVWCVAVGALEVLFYTFYWLNFAGSASTR